VLGKSVLVDLSSKKSGLTVETSEQKTDQPTQGTGLERQASQIAIQPPIVVDTQASTILLGYCSDSSDAETDEDAPPPPPLASVPDDASDTLSSEEAAESSSDDEPPLPPPPAAASSSLLDLLDKDEESEGRDSESTGAELCNIMDAFVMRRGTSDRKIVQNGLHALFS